MLTGLAAGGAIAGRARRLIGRRSCAATGDRQGERGENNRRGDLLLHDSYSSLLTIAVASLRRE